jgi:outer membrane receptor protein involved in Fe transport
MANLRLMSATALQSVLIVGAFGFAQTAAAQTAPATDPATPVAATEVSADASTSKDDCAANPNAPDCRLITVTGSRIRRDSNLKSVVPVTSVGPQDLTSRGEVSLGDALNDLPALRATFSQANSTGAIGTAGLSILDLRGLGTVRTLVLVNGRRHVTAQPGNYNVDVNTIPVDLLERVDVVTGGNSAIYGSDAVAGVVNFILRKDFEGAKIRAQTGISNYGDRNNKFISGVLGKNFMDGRLNVTLHGEYSKSDEVFFSDRPYLGAYTGPSGFITDQITNAPNRNFDGIPNVRFYDNQGGNVPGITFGNLSTGGYVLTTCPAPVATNAARVAAACTGELNPTGGRIARNYSFLPDGSLAPDVPFIDNRRIGGGTIGGLSATGLEDAMLLPGLERMVGNVFINANVSDAFQPFFEGKFVRINATQQSTQPTFVASTLNPTFSINNPFLTPQARAQIVTLNAPGATTFLMQRFNNDIGTRAEDHRRDTYRFVGGVRGDLSTKGNLRYELALNYGHTKTFYTTGGNVNVAKFNNATNAVRNAAGQIVCGINADTITTNDDPNCAPLNLFGYGNESAAALAYVIQQSSRKQTASQLNAVGFLSGDSEGYFELPGGPIGFAVGGEYRREKATSVYDLGTQRGETFLNAFQPFLPPAAVIKEAFGELRLPIIRDTFLLNELTVEGAARYSKYRGIKGVWAYNAGLIYSPVEGIRLRGGIAKSVRAPNLTDQFGARAEAFANGLTDPCDQPGGTNNTNNITTDPNRAANCALAGVPTTITYQDSNGVTITRPFTNVPGSGIAGINSGNANLVPETSKSFTVGTVIQPPFMRGFSLTVDYFNIKVKNVISGLTGQAIINRCYDDPTGINNEFCSAIFRRQTADPITNGTFNGQTSRRLDNRNQDSFPRAGDGISFINQPYNFAARVRQGIDFDASYRSKLFGGKALTLRGIATYLIKSEDFSFLTQPDRSDKIDGTFGDPKWAASWNANFDLGKIDFTYGGTFNGKQTILAYETQFEHQGRGPTNPDARPFRNYPSQIVHNARINFEPTERYRFYAGVDNFTNELPPYDVTGIESGTISGSTYSPNGRYFYAGAEIKFK